MLGKENPIQIIIGNQENVEQLRYLRSLVTLCQGS